MQEVCKYHTVNYKGPAPGSSQVPNSLEPRREMQRPGSSFRPNYATVGGKEGEVEF